MWLVCTHARLGQGRVYGLHSEMPLLSDTMLTLCCDTSVFEVLVSTKGDLLLLLKGLSQLWQVSYLTHSALQGLQEPFRNRGRWILGGGARL